ncbi:MAG TPA: hypothetical protein P5548_03625 [Candidatus Moranbacteria bacterium]|nr:hypothetical protein [Candidatus Moranbacteria bacterium]
MSKQKKFLIKYGIAAIVFCMIFAVASILKVNAGTSENGSGWLWGGSDDGAGNKTGVGWISANNINSGAGGSVSYGLNIPTSSSGGDLSGYAWSENLGYIAFDNSGGYLSGCPDGNCVSKRVADNTLQGWARIVSIADAYKVGNSGGWLGWIKLNGTAQNGSKYGVLVASDGKLSGYAWSDELGWINFSGSSTGPTVYPTCTLPWGGTIDNGQSVDAYSSSSVACGSSCDSVKQNRTCTNGVLSGTATNQNCSVAPCPCTTPWGTTVASGSSVDAYKDSYAPYGSECVKETRQCTDGSLNGSYTNQSCCQADNCEQRTCQGKQCNNGCKLMDGVKTDGACCVSNGCEKNTCKGKTCNNGCISNAYGTKKCSGPVGPGIWTEE